MATYETKDMAQAAYLFCQPNGELIGLEDKGARTGRITVYFQFSFSDLSEEGVRSMILDYANGNTLVDPLDYNNKMASLRDLLHSQLNKRR